MFYLATKELQRINYTLSDFYGQLIAIRENLKAYSNTAVQTNDLAAYLLTGLNGRLPLLLKNPLMVCAVFLDRRFSSELNTDEKVFALRALVKLWEGIRSEYSQNNNSIENNTSFEFKHKDNVLENYFNAKGIEVMVDNLNNTPNYMLTNVAMFDTLRNFDEKVGRQPTNKNVLEFWEQNKTKFPEIYLLSAIINAVPPTQTTTERCFSGLNFIYDNKRSNLSLILLEQILLIRLNKDLVSTILAEDLEKKKMDE